MYVYVYMCICVCVYICIYVHMYICIHVYHFRNIENMYPEYKQNAHRFQSWRSFQWVPPGILWCFGIMISKWFSAQRRFQLIPSGVLWCIGIMISTPFPFTTELSTNSLGDFVAFWNSPAQIAFHISELSPGGFCGVLEFWFPHSFQQSGGFNHPLCGVWEFWFPHSTSSKLKGA